MSQPINYSIYVEDGDIVLRFNREAIAMNALNRFLDYLQFESIAQKSQLTEEQATALAEEIDRDVWNKIKHKYLPS